MNSNVYYVGSQRHNILARQNITNYKNRNIYLQRNNSQPKQKSTSRSTSCPKTERSKFSISSQRMRQRSPITNINLFTPSKANDRSTDILAAKNNKSLATVKQITESKYSSAFEIIQAKPINIEINRPKNLFKKVEQPRNRQFLKPIIKQQYTNNKLEQKKELIFKDNIKINNIIIDAANKIQNQMQESIDQQYKIQPLRKLFLCTRCYQFTPIIELRGHYRNCSIPIKKQNFKDKWIKLINLLQQIYREQQSNILYRLIDRLEWYISQCNITKREGYILYSEELASILAMKGMINLSCLNQSDLFWLIEAIGDLIQTKSIDIDQTAFWKICT